MIALPEQLKTFRKNAGYTQEDVASSVGVSAQSVSKWERGECYPDITLLPALANLFDTSIDVLMGMDILRADAHRNAIFTSALNSFRSGDYEKAASILQDHLALFPNDLGAMGEFSLHLGMMAKHRKEAITLAETVLERSAPLKVQHTVRAGLCLLYASEGQMEKAQALAAHLPHRRESREDIQNILQRTDSGAWETYQRYLVLGE